MIPASDKQDAIKALEWGNARNWTIHRERESKSPSTTWPHRPEPLPGEAFSSYFTRAAKANFAEPLQVLHVLNPKVPKKGKDLDRILKDEILQKIAQALGRDAQEIRALHVGGKFNNGMLLIGSRYCPFCLREDGDTQIQTQIQESLVRIVNEGGLDPIACAPLTPAAAFRGFLRAQCPQWHACTFGNLVAFLFTFVREKNPACTLSVFSGYMGLTPSTVFANLEKFGLQTCAPPREIR